MARVLMNGGRKVTTAANAKDAIRAADEQRFDLLLSSVKRQLCDIAIAVVGRQVAEISVRRVKRH
jgi:CheY-like chemotaxis protein